MGPWLHNFLLGLLSSFLPTCLCEYVEHHLAESEGHIRACGTIFLAQVYHKYEDMKWVSGCTCNTLFLSTRVSRQVTQRIVLILSWIVRHLKVFLHCFDSFLFFPFLSKVINFRQLLDKVSLRAHMYRRLIVFKTKGPCKNPVLNACILSDNCNRCQVKNSQKSTVFYLHT